MASEESVVRTQGFTLSQMVEGLEQAGARFVESLRRIDSQDGAKPVPRLKWNVAETAVHMLSVVRRGLGDRRRSDSIPGLADLNDLNLDEVEERDVKVLADLIEADMKTYIAVLGSLPADAGSTVVQLHANLKAELSTALSYQFIDFLVHGHDVSAGAGVPYEIPPQHAILAILGCMPALGPWVHEHVRDGATRRASFTFPGFDGSIVAVTGEGGYEVRPGARDDADVEVDPVELMLTVAGRIDAGNDHIAAFASWYGPI